MRWPLTFIVKDLPHNFAGQVRGPVILIKRGFENDEGLYQHEIVHLKQFFYQGLIIHNLRYQFSKSYRYRCEIEGYRKQLEYTHSPALFASFICHRYNLDVNSEDVLRDLLK